MKLWVKYHDNDSKRFDGKTFQEESKNIVEVNGKEVDHELGFKEGDLVVIKRPGKGGSSKRSRVWNATIVSENVPKPTSKPKQQKNDSKSSQRIAKTYVKKKKGRDVYRTVVGCRLDMRSYVVS